ncbi:N-acetylmuramoyl-L-alanine amidase family protein [Flavobacterium wongokense]|uniref:N-acetylmuramoyl-L-alanine amidase family protein n=1 Tax=Flavobacterium wongokense TaxID=2910674 RepID=UPI001F47DEDC|nr:N-acetylmuramoyl-L-alanine amidase [Flavobacterium sp. WG47]MCF6131948.1 N-acetylmuramoyl-L-alanine amidase [Flavobacterium sp. WG47]
MRFSNYIKSCFTILFVFSILNVFGQGASNKFVLVLDAGHGGKDPGNSYHGYVEKDIALKTTLKVGKFLEREEGFQVTYTRKTDEFIELVNRPKIANKINADLFVSIHCNSVKNFEPEGTETFVMGLSRTNMNMEVAKSENSVILLEENYKQTYKGFDPNKPENLIGLKIMQEENLYSSINLATTIQENFTNKLSRKTRGVKQQPLWVLDAAKMPGVLIELGFLSNKEEGEYLNSDEGQTEMARQIANSIIHYKKMYFNEPESVNDSRVVEKPYRPEPKVVVEDTVVKSNDTIAAAEVIEGQGIYKVQLFASSKKKDIYSKDFKGLNNISVTFENNLYRYYYGKSYDLNIAKRLNSEAKSHGFPDAFIVVFADGKVSALK